MTQDFDTRIIAPGSTIGIMGNGQLGRMAAFCAAELGYKVHVFGPGPTARPNRFAPRQPLPITPI